MDVTYIDHMGDDLRVVNAARVSFHKESKWETNPHIMELGLSEQDQKLISYLAKHNHWTPFSHVQITLRERVPIFVARQRFKHMVGFTYNEVSRRYVDDAPEFFSPDIWRGKPINAKQGSSDEPVGNQKKVKYDYEGLIDHAKTIYEEMIEQGVAPEQARMVLPQSMLTEYYCTGSLAAWARAYRLRSDPHSQFEIQQLAKQWDETISNIPELHFSWSALKG